MRTPVSPRFPFLWTAHWPAWLRQTLPLFAVVCAATITCPEELLPTGGLETPPVDLPVASSAKGKLPSGWSLWGDGRASIVTDPAETGGRKQAVRLEPAGETQGSTRLRLYPSERIPVQAGAEYLLTARVKGTGKATLFLWGYSVSGVFLASQAKGGAMLGPTGEPIQAVFRIEDDDVALVSAGVEVEGQGSWAVVSDLSLTVDRGQFPRSTVDLSGGWLLGNPREIFIPRQGCVFMRAALRSPVAGEIKDFRLVFTVPAFLRLLNYDQPGGNTRDLPPEKVVTTPVQVKGQPGWRYELQYPATRVVSPDAKIGVNWQLEANPSQRAPIAAVLFQMEGHPTEASYPITAQRLVNGKESEPPTPLVLRVMPEFSGKTPKRVQIYYYSQCVFPAAIQEITASGWSAAYPREVADAVWQQYSKLGVNRCELGNWGVEEKPVFREFVAKLRKSGVQVGFARLSGMNYLAGYLTDSAPDGSPDVNREVLGILAAHPETQCRFYSGRPDTIPAAWKDSVYFRWFDTRLLFDSATRARRPAAWCQEYLANGGPLYLDYWRRRFQTLQSKMPVDFVHWDWEYANVGWSCFCERDLEAFRAFAKLPAGAPLSEGAIAQKHAEAWMKFRVWQNARLMGHFHKMLNNLGLQFEAYPAFDNSLVEGLEWTLAVGAFDVAFCGSPGAYPDKFFKASVEKSEKDFQEFKLPTIGQLIIDENDGTNHPAEVQQPGRRMNAMLRTVAIARGGVNPWVNIGSLLNVNGVECFERAAIDVIVKYEPYFLDGARATGEFDVKGLRSAGMDLAAFRLAQDQPVLLLAFNDSKRDRLAEITWNAAAAATAYYDGLSGKRLGDGKTVRLPLGPCSCAVVECRGK